MSYVKRKAGYLMDLPPNWRPLSVAREDIIGDDTFLDRWMDPAGFIGNKWPDGIDCGDGMQRTAMYIIGSCLASFTAPYPVLKKRILAHKIGPAAYVRRPNPQPWRASEMQWMGRLNTTTGDQVRPIVVAMGLLNMKDELKELAWALFKRAGFYWNTRDTGNKRENKFQMPGWSGPEHWNLFIRALWPRSNFLVKLMLLPGDLIAFFANLHSVFSYSQEPQNVDQVNRMIVLLQGVLVQPTFLSKLNMYIFRKYRPTWDVYVDDNWLRVYRPNKNLNPGLYVIETYFWNRDIDPPFSFGPWRDICEEYFGRL